MFHQGQFVKLNKTVAVVLILEVRPIGHSCFYMIENEDGDQR